MLILLYTSASSNNISLRELKNQIMDLKQRLNETKKELNQHNETNEQLKKQIRNIDENYRNMHNDYKKLLQNVQNNKNEINELKELINKEIDLLRTYIQTIEGLVHEIPKERLDIIYQSIHRKVEDLLHICNNNKLTAMESEVDSLKKQILLLKDQLHYKNKDCVIFQECEDQGINNYNTNFTIVKYIDINNEKNIIPKIEELNLEEISEPIIKQKIPLKNTIHKNTKSQNINKVKKISNNIKKTYKKILKR